MSFGLQDRQNPEGAQGGKFFTCFHLQIPDVHGTHRAPPCVAMSLVHDVPEGTRQ
jgi:hypothetical protein